MIIPLIVVASSPSLAACGTRNAIFTPGADVTLPVLVNSVRPQYTQDAFFLAVSCAPTEASERLRWCVPSIQSTASDNSSHPNRQALDVQTREQAWQTSSMCVCRSTSKFTLQ